jgi:hypothetical protein
MPVPKSRLKQVGLIEEIAELLQIDPSLVFLDALPLRDRTDDADDIRAKRSRGHRRNTIRIWTQHMDDGEIDRLHGLKDEAKAMAAKVNTKVAMSDRHPLSQAGFEERRRTRCGKKFNMRRALERKAQEEKEAEERASE